MPYFDLNIYALIAAAVLQMIIGFLWYSPFLFGKAWMHAQGITDDKRTEMKQKGMAKTYVGAFAASIVTSYILGLVIKAFGANASEGLIIGLLMWFGFVLAKSFTDLLFDNKNRMVFLISVSYQCASLLAMGALLGRWA